MGTALHGYLPLFVLEGASELFTDVELPEFSQFVNGEIIAADDRRQLRIPNFNNIDFSEGARVQISSDRFTPRTVTLGTAGENNAFALATDVSLSAGPVSVRRQIGSNFWTGLRDVVHNTLPVLTLGGVMNLVDSEFAGEARIVPYESNDISDWHNYFDATVPDPARPASIQIEARTNGDTLTLQPPPRRDGRRLVALVLRSVRPVPAPAASGS